MKVLPTTLPGVLLFEPRVFGDARGFFLETFRADRYREFGIANNFIQDNWSRSKKGILRGLHFQHPLGQGKLVMVTLGSIFDVAVDIRRGSPTFGKWFGCTLSEDNKHQLWIPPGFAHGFCVTSEVADVLYKCTEFYAPGNEHTLLWNDPELGIVWPEGPYVLSEKDKAGLPLARLPNLPPMQA